MTRAFDAIIEQQKARVDAANELLYIIREFPDLFDDFAAARAKAKGNAKGREPAAEKTAGSNGTPAPLPNGANPYRPTEELVVAYLKKHGPTPVGTISKAIDRSPTSIAYVGKTKGTIERVDGLWRLREPAEPEESDGEGAYRSPGDRLEELLKEAGPLGTTEAAKRLGYANSGGLYRTLKSDPRFYNDNGTIHLRPLRNGFVDLPTTPSLSSPEPSSTVGTNA